jgi:hypothetical protein
MPSLSQTDLQQITDHGISPEVIEQQLSHFIEGFPPIRLNRVASVGDGIEKFPDLRIKELVANYDSSKSAIEVLKFVPASGAASRMFQPLFAYLENGMVTPPIKQFADHMHNFAFYDQLQQNCPACDLKASIYTLLNKMRFAELPKALIPFHRYESSFRTAIEEHLAEGSLYAAANKTVLLHFTVSAEHEEKIKTHLNEVKIVLEKQYDVTFNLSFSVQSPATDTIAVNPDNTPFRNTDGSLLFRPGGHGALINNLNHQEADLIFVKNIDNVRPDHLKADTILYKKVIAGYLLELKSKIHGLLSALNEGSKSIAELEELANKELNIQLPTGYNAADAEGKKAILMAQLNKPVRVCGMVRNEGEPGGGPFWVEDSSGQTTLQIVEKSQVQLEHAAQNDILNSSTHFNPVDLVCWVKDYQGNKFNLNDFVDPGTGFITEKSKDGKTLKAMELPGLWNGAMADWLTYFVEVPSTTFSPVKTVLDLLRPEHQPA